MRVDELLEVQEPAGTLSLLGPGTAEPCAFDPEAEGVLAQEPTEEGVELALEALGTTIEVPPGATAGRLAAARGRDDLVRLRLSRLLEALGEVPSPPASLRVHERGHALAQMLGGSISRGARLLSGRYIPGRALELGCVVVSPRGVAVVDIAPGDRCAGRARETLRRANALRGFLDGTPWSEVPVLAAVCSLGGSEAETDGAPPVVLDRLWLGDKVQLTSWLMGDGPLDAAACRALGAFLDAELPG
jgi:hypothetical protein